MTFFTSVLLVSLSLVIQTPYIAIADVQQVKADCADPCTCGQLTWNEKLTYPVTVESNTDYDYIFSPCGLVNCGNTTEPVVICQHDKANNIYVRVGTSRSVRWTLNGNDTTKFTVTYGDGEKTMEPIPRDREGTISVTLTEEGDTGVKFVGEEDKTEIINYVFTANIRPGGVPAGVAPGIAGIVIMCLCLAALVAYFIIGSVVMYTLKGARGLEVIPQYTFWATLPYLIKDGVVFTFSPCCKKSTYSSLK